MPNRITAGTPSFTASPAAFTASSTEYWKWPGMDEMGRFSPLPGRMNSGRTKSPGFSSISRTRARSSGEARRRLGLGVGKVMTGILLQSRHDHERSLDVPRRPAGPQALVDRLAQARGHDGTLLAPDPAQGAGRVREHG